MSAIDELLARHRAFHSTHTPAEVASPRPRLRVVIVTCMDARIDIFRALGLHPGEVHMLRNAGGLVTDDMLRSLILSQRLLGSREVMVVMHTDCGLEGQHDAELTGRITAETQLEPPFAFGGFDDVEAEVQRSVERIRACPWIPTRQFVRGFIYDVQTARLHELGDAAIDADSDSDSELTG
jgi:carbonic anhydrase